MGWKPWASPLPFLHIYPLQLSLPRGVPGVHVVINFTDGKLMHFPITASEPPAFQLLVKLTHQGQWSLCQGPNCPYLQFVLGP